MPARTCCLIDGRSPHIVWAKMERMDTYARMDRFWADLVARREYRTPPGRQDLLPRYIPGLTTCHLHFGVTAALMWTNFLGSTGRLDEYNWARCALLILRAIERSGGRFVVTGVSNLISEHKSVVIVSNHMSSLETYIMASFVMPFRDMAFVLKASLLRHPFVGALMRSIRPIAVGRQNPRDDFKKVITEGVPMLKSGRSVLIFPQSTRTATFDASEFNSLGTKLACHAGVPVIPLALKTDFLENGRLVKDFGVVRPERTLYMEFGPLMTIEGHGKKQHEAVVRFITERLVSWGAQSISTPRAGTDPARDTA